MLISVKLLNAHASIMPSDDYNHADRVLQSCWSHLFGKSINYYSSLIRPSVFRQSNLFDKPARDRKSMLYMNKGSKIVPKLSYILSSEMFDSKLRSHSWRRSLFSCSNLDLVAVMLLDLGSEKYFDLRGLWRTTLQIIRARNLLYIRFEAASLDIVVLWN